MPRFQPCDSLAHRISRRSLMQGLLAGAGGMLSISRLAGNAVADQLAKSNKRVLVFFLAGGSSQLETWDPKPGTDTGGPFRAIPTSVTGVHISELLPHSARQMHRLALVRGVNTNDDDHGRGHVYMETGRRPMPGVPYPVFGSVAAKLLSPDKSPLPGYIHISPGGGGRNKQDAAFLGPKYAPIGLGDGKPPADLARPGFLTEQTDHVRNAIRRQVDDKFLRRRRSAETEAYTNSYEQAAELIRRREIFDLSKETAKDVERYGTHDFGRHCLMARRLLEQGITCVKVTHTNYDTHFENFTFHIEQLGEFDRPFATLIGDLADRGLLESTLVVVMAEFGRTPTINHLLGRDHWSHAWSVALAGAKIKPGAVVGKTNERGTAVIDRQVNAADLFHTYLLALGLNPADTHEVAGQSIPIGDPAAAGIKELIG